MLPVEEKFKKKKKQLNCDVLLLLAAILLWAKIKDYSHAFVGGKKNEVLGWCCLPFLALPRFVQNRRLEVCAWVLR